MIKVIEPNSGINIKDIEALTKPGKVIVMEPIVKHLKIKKEIPTVIEYLGRRYVLDYGNK